MLKPIRNLVYIRPIFDSDKTSSGLLIVPEVGKSRCDQGIVIYMGPDCVSNIVPGDWVLFPNYNGRLMHIDGKPFIIMEDHAISAVLDREHEGDKIPGLYIKTGLTDGNRIVSSYEEVTYATAWTIIADAMSENLSFRQHREKKHKKEG